MNYRECAELLLAQDRLLIITHKNPDGDTAASAAALCNALRRKGKAAYLFPNPELSNKLLGYVGQFYAKEDFQPSFIVSVDVATESMFALGFEGEVDLCIDHHPTNSHYAARELIRDEKSSCGEIVLDVIKALCSNISPEEATLLYIAVTTDTGCFQYANTNARTLQAAAELVRQGADNHAVSLQFFRKLSPARIRLEGAIYSSLSFHRGGKVTIAVVTQQMLRDSGATNEDCDDLAGIPGRVESSVVSVTIKETAEGGSKVSVRSMPEVSSSDICAVFGGGGHNMAAGCTIGSAPEKAKEMLLAVIDEVWK